MLVLKGSIAVDGISLTVAALGEDPSTCRSSRTRGRTRTCAARTPACA